MAKPAVTIVGAGLVGALLAALLAQRGFAVTVYERRPDPRVAGYAGGRSINLALAERGLHGLRLAGMKDTVMRLAVMMRGRMVHHRDGHTELLRYGRDDSEVIWSVSRGRLNIALIDAAEKAGARFEFDRRLTGATFDDGVMLRFENEAGVASEAHVAFAIGADGAGSALRAAMNAHAPLGERIEPLGHGYKELEIPAASGASRFAIEPNALHIWPRGNYMCIALPNAEGSFTVTLFLPNEGDPSFATVDSPAAARKLFERDFADALPLIPDLEADFAANPVGMLATLYLDRWHIDGRALLVGDAAHAIVPFHGQGMNCGFEDAVALADLFAAGASDIDAVFAGFERRAPAERRSHRGDGARELHRNARLRRRSRVPAAPRARPHARVAESRPFRAALLDGHVHAHALRRGVCARRRAGARAARADERQAAHRRDRSRCGRRDDPR